MESTIPTELHPTKTTAVILAGGEGVRLRTPEGLALSSQPKLLIEISVNNRRAAMIDYVLGSVHSNGFHEIIVATATSPIHGDAVRLHVVNNCAARHRILHEPAPRGTGSAVQNALHAVHTPYTLIIPGDTVFPFEGLPHAVARHQQLGRVITLTVTTHPDSRAQNFRRIICEPSCERIKHNLEGRLDTGPVSSDGETIRATSGGILIAKTKETAELLAKYSTEIGLEEHYDLYRDFLPWTAEGQTALGYYDMVEPIYDLGSPERIALFLGRQRPRPGRREIAS